MSFISFAFAVFYLLVLAVRWLPMPRGDYATTVRIFALLLLSWLFYAWHVPWYLLLILFSTAVDYVAGLIMSTTPAENARRRRLVLCVSLVANIGLLAYFKYAGLFVDTVNAIAGSEFSWAAVVLPIGISFYTFQSMSYSIDVYRGDIPAERNFLRFATYIAFFPQLVAGPIVRASAFLYQFRRRRRFHWKVFITGAYLILRGLFLKLVVADNLGRIVDQQWAQAATDPQGVLALSVLVFFACQLLCDFAGYVDIARGVAYQLGFRLPINFNAPYLALTFSEFWRRWHITLSDWMRDYLYKPLGGNRRHVVRNYLNLVLVMLISGLWHGASWNFVAWGGMLGVALALERVLRLTEKRLSIFSVLLWFVVVQLTWIFSMAMFRANGIEQGLAVMGSAAVGAWQLLLNDFELGEAADVLQLGWWFTLPVWLWHGRAWIAEHTRVGEAGALERSVYAGLMFAAVLQLYATGKQFIYFQF